MNSIAAVSSTGVFTPLGAFNDSLNVGVRLALPGTPGVITTMIHFDNPKYTYVGGLFSYAGNVPAYNIARYNWASGQWSELDGGVNGNPTYPVTSMVLSGNQIIVAGTFTRAGSLMVNNVAAFDLILQKWVPLNDALVGTIVAKVGFFNGLILAAGTITGASEVTGGVLANIAAFNGKQWTSLFNFIPGLAGSVPTFISLNGYLFYYDSLGKAWKASAGSTSPSLLSGFLVSLTGLYADYSGRPIFVINTATGEGKMYDPILDNVVVAPTIGPNSVFYTKI